MGSQRLTGWTHRDRNNGCSRGSLSQSRRASLRRASAKATELDTARERLLRERGLQCVHVKPRQVCSRQGLTGGGLLPERQPRLHTASLLWAPRKATCAGCAPPGSPSVQPRIVPGAADAPQRRDLSSEHTNGQQLMQTRPSGCFPPPRRRAPAGTRHGEESPGVGGVWGGGRSVGGRGGRLPGGRLLPLELYGGLQSPSVPSGCRSTPRPQARVQAHSHPSSPQLPHLCPLGLNTVP